MGRSFPARRSARLASGNASRDRRRTVATPWQLRRALLGTRERELERTVVALCHRDGTERPVLT